MTLDGFGGFLSAITGTRSRPRAAVRALTATACAMLVIGAALLPSGGASATSAVRSAPTPAGGWHTAWKDDFNGTTLNPGRWTTWTASYSEGCRGNLPWFKLEYNLPRNIAVDHGRLVITAKREHYTSPAGVDYDWTSGLITTGDSCGHDPAHGVLVHRGDYIQVHAKLPSALGMWPAFWTWNKGDNEVDVFEYHPDNRTILELNNHTPGGGGDYFDNGTDWSQGWHYYGAYLGADHVEWYVDGKKVYSDATGFNSDGAYLIVDLGVVDGTYHPKPPAQVDSARMYVDSVSVFRK